MKKTLYLFCIVISLMLLSACGSIKIDESNYLEQYNNFKTEFDDADSIKTLSKTSVTTTVNDESSVSEFTTDYSKQKNGDNYDCYVNLNMSDEESPIIMDIYYSDGSMYASEADYDYKQKLEASYEDFDFAYNAVKVESIEEDTIGSKEIVTNEDGTTTAKLVLNKDSYPDFFESEIMMIENITYIPSELFDYDTSDIEYDITFDKKGNVSNITYAFTVDVNISLASILGIDEQTAESYGVVDQNIIRDITVSNDIENIGSTKVTLPNDLDSYATEDANVSQEDTASDTNTDENISEDDTSEDIDSDAISDTQN